MSTSNKKDSYMNKLLSAFLFVALLCSCADSYDIKGSSNVSNLDGRKLYLKVIKDGELKNIDSCDVVHGQFSFSGTLDSVRMAGLYMDNESVLPVVLERGCINIKIDDTHRSCIGTPLNDKLSKFLDSYNRLESQVNELSHKQSRAIMNGDNLDDINSKLEQEAQQIAIQEDRLVTSFITENFDNVLGPGVFMMVTSGFRFPELTPWIEDIMSKATDTFKRDPYVKEYIEAAQRNQNIMNGLENPTESDAQMLPSQPTAPPTPNELAQPSQTGRQGQADSD